MKNFQVLPYPRMRRLVQDAGWMARRRHVMHGFVTASQLQ